MKKIFCIILLVVFVSFLNISYISAEDNDDETLNLDTEEIKNKKDDYSSLTDMNGLNLFTNDLKIILDNETNTKISENKKVENTLFTNKIKNNSSNRDEKDKLFSNSVNFDKTIGTKKAEISLAPFFAIGTLFLGIIVFVLTRKKYKNEESGEIEINNNLYE